ncbi:hypothetical protein B0H11DRAFT_1909840 [Mycena galericulata]|nr:hypothetical protein B0H11DRAFT_1909840 [Mycena galericulata]
MTVVRSLSQERSTALIRDGGLKVQVQQTQSPLPTSDDLNKENKVERQILFALDRLETSSSYAHRLRALGAREWRDLGALGPGSDTRSTAGDGAGGDSGGGGGSKGSGSSEDPVKLLHERGEGDPGEETNAAIYVDTVRARWKQLAATAKHKNGFMALELYTASSAVRGIRLLGLVTELDAEGGRTSAEGSGVSFSSISEESSCGGTTSSSSSSIPAIST